MKENNIKRVNEEKDDDQEIVRRPKRMTIVESDSDQEVIEQSKKRTFVEYSES